MRSQTALCSSGVRPLFSAAAEMPRALAADTWSCIREMSGEITIVSPPSTTAGTWKQTDLPAPVGRTASVSCPLRTDRTTPAWAGRKSG